MGYRVYSEDIGITEPLSNAKEVRDWLKTNEVEVLDIKHSMIANGKETFYIVYDSESYKNLTKSD